MHQAADARPLGLTSKLPLTGRHLLHAKHVTLSHLILKSAQCVSAGSTIPMRKLELTLLLLAQVQTAKGLSWDSVLGISEFILHTSMPLSHPFIPVLPHGRVYSFDPAELLSI